MAGDVIASLLIKLGLNADGVQTGVKKAQDSFSGIGTGAKVAFGVAAGAAAVGFGLMAKGAAEMETAQGRFQAATGGSREEAARFADDMNGLVGTNATVGRSFTEISDAGVAIAQQFDATGEAGKALTADFLAFSKVTRQDAVGAVNDFDAALDAFGEPAERATSLMDQLIASNQKYGTVAGPAAIDTLAKMAPALAGMNMGLDEGVALLNLFEASGIDASKAPTLLNKAIQTLKPGQDLDDLIAQLADIEDPLVRAQEAARIFGVRSGNAMANAIRPGMRSLDEFGISAEQAAGKTDAASEALVTTSDRFRMFFDQIGGGLRGLGADFGPLVSGIAGLGTLIAPMGGKLTKALSAVWGKVGGAAAVRLAVGAAGTAAGLAYTAGAFVASKLVSAAVAAWALMGGPKVVAAAAAAGAKTGAAFAGAAAAGGLLGSAAGLLTKGLPLLLRAIPPVAIAVTVGWIVKEPLRDFLDKQFGEVGREMQGDFGDSVAFSELAKKKGFVVKDSFWGGLIWDPTTGKFISEDVRKSLREELWGPTIEGAKGDLTKSFGASLARASSDRLVAWDKLTDTLSPPAGALQGQAMFDRWASSMNIGAISSTLQKLAGDVIQGGEPVVDAFGDVFGDAVHEITKGFGNVKQALEGGSGIVSPEKRLENMRSRLEKASQNLRKAIAVGDPIGIDRWTKGVERASSVLDHFEGRTGQTRREVAAELDAMGLHSERVFGKFERGVGRHSQGARQKAVRQLRGLVGDLSGIDLSGAGARLIQSWVAGIRSMQEVVQDAGRAVTGWLGQFFHGSAVPKVGPLAGLDRQGADMIGAWLGGIDKQEPRVRRTGDRLASALQPSLSPAAAGAMRGGGRAAGGHGNDCFHLHVHGDLINTDADYRKMVARQERAVRPTRRERRRG